MDKDTDYHITSPHTQEPDVNFPADEKMTEYSGDMTIGEESNLPQNYPSLVATESLESFDSGKLRHASLTVSDLIDALPQFQHNENVEERSNAATNNYISNDLDKDTDYLVNYLSKKAPGLRSKDPPSLDELQSTHNCNDPPLVPFIRSDRQSPEVNPKKEFSTSSVLFDTNSSCDPEINKPLLFDVFGELNSSIQDTLHLSIDSNTDISIHINSEKMIDLPKCRSTVLTIPNVFKESDLPSDTMLEPEGLHPASRDFTAAVRNLYVLLLGLEDASEEDIYLFGQLIQFSLTFLLKTSDLSAFADSQILTRANELKVSLVLADRFLETIHTLPSDVRGKYDDLDSLTNMTRLLQDLCANIEVGVDNQVDVSADGMMSCKIIPSDIFEIVENDGFVSREFRQSRDEEPWWEVAARLNGTPCIDELKRGATTDILAMPSDCGVMDDSDTMDNSERNPINSIENDITTFWKGIVEARHLELEKRKTKGIKLHRSFARDDRIGKAASFSHLEESRRLESLTACTTWSDSSGVRSMPHLSRREVQQKWSSKLAMADGTVITGKVISAVEATASLQRKNLLQNKFPFSNVWRNSYEKLTENHDGFFDVDIYSLYASTVVGTMRHSLDNVPWESRPVKQRFLYEQSISFTRNWFGCLTATNVNTKIKEPVCRPKSMEMPMEADEWTEEWYRRSKDTPGMVKMMESLDDSDDDDTWEDAPECGKIKTVRLRPGERITRVTPDLTCYLRRSRWRKKHFPEGNFPTV